MMGCRRGSRDWPGSEIDLPLPRETVQREFPACFAVIVLMFSLGLSGCAKIQAPPGGPEDHTPPKIVATTPATGSVNVARDVTVQVEFSEPIIKNKLAAAIYISPRPAAAPGFSGGKKIMAISWPDSLAANTTYLITIAAQIGDLRNNKLLDSYVLAFSTGPAIDSGTVTGIVYDGDKPAPNTQVVLFALPLDSADAIYIPPDYITESGANGAFSFTYLPGRNYRAYALVDKNKNRTLDYGEKSGVGAFDILLTPDEYVSPPLFLYLQDSDTTVFSLKQCRVNPDRVVQAKFSHEVDTSVVRSAGWEVRAVNDSTRLPVRAVAPDPQEPTAVRLILADAAVGISYRLHVGGLSDIRGGDLDTVPATAEFFWPSAPDTVLPAVAKSIPTPGATAVSLSDPLQLWFSEPVDTARAAASLYLADSAGNRVAGTILWSGNWELLFAPGADLAGGMQYLLVLDSAGLVDAVGNASTARWVADFTTFDPQNLGAITGSLTVTPAEWQNLPIIVEFLAQQERAFSRRMTFSARESFSFDTPADRYLMRATVDLNRNGRFDPGAVLPHAPAEPRFNFPDTIDVRARFTTEGVDLTIP
jgi:methionine-rich copper-binding protein CopC